MKVSIEYRATTTQQVIEYLQPIKEGKRTAANQ
jgi:hypothetical protein